MSSIESDWYQGLFKLFHNIIIANGKSVVKDVREIYEFVTILDDGTKVDFTMDLKFDRGKIFVGSCADAIKREDTWLTDDQIKEDYKASLVFTMKDADFRAMLGGTLNPAKAYMSRKI